MSLFPENISAFCSSEIFERSSPNDLANILLRITNFGFFTAMGDNFVAIISGKSA